MTDICPLFSMMNGTQTQCLGSACSWFKSGGCCSVWVIANSLESIMNK